MLSTAGDGWVVVVSGTVVVVASVEVVLDDVVGSAAGSDVEVVGRGGRNGRR